MVAIPAQLARQRSIKTESARFLPAQAMSGKAFVERCTKGRPGGRANDEPGGSHGGVKPQPTEATERYARRAPTSLAAWALSKFPPVAAFSAPMTLPMSRLVCAPTSAMVFSTRVTNSSPASCLGR